MVKDMFDIITKEQAENFIDRIEAGDETALKGIYEEISKNQHKDIITSIYLLQWISGLKYWNSVIMGMELDDIKLNRKVDNMYRKGMRTLYEKCEQIINKKED